MTDRTVQVAGATLAMTNTGTGEPALIFLHYCGGSSRTWDMVVTRLEQETRCGAIDQRGWGRSVVADGRYDLHAMGDDVQSVAEQLRLSRYILVGHSMGGKVAQIVAARQVSWLVGLVLVAPAPPTPMPVPEAQRAAMLASSKRARVRCKLCPFLRDRRCPKRCASR